MKLHVILTVLVMSSLFNCEVQGIRLRKVTLSAISHQEMVEGSPIEGSKQDHELLAKLKTAEFSSGMNRKLMTKITSSSTTTTFSKNYKNYGNRGDPIVEVKSTFGLVGKDDNFLFSSSPDDSKQSKTEIAPEPYPEDLSGMDYTPANRKAPIHN